MAGTIELVAAIRNTGLRLELLNRELPQFAETTLTIYELISKQLQWMVLMLRRMVGWDDMVAKGQLDNHVESKPALMPVYGHTRHGGKRPAGDAPETPTISMKQVARSLFKIMLGAVLGVLLFFCVQRL